MTSVSTCDAAASRQSGARRCRDAMVRRQELRSFGLLRPSACDVEKHFFQGGAIVASKNSRRSIVVFNASTLQDDDAIAQPLDLEHVMRGKQDRRIAGLAIALQAPANPIG